MTFRLTVSLFGLLIAALVLTNGCTKAPDACRALQGSEKNKCIIDAAVAQRNPKLCEQFKENIFNAWCFTDVANVTNSTAPCEGIIDPRSREFCRRDVFLQQGIESACAALDHVPARDSCYAEFARRDADWRLCLNITPGTLREQCIDTASRKATDPEGCLVLDKSDLARDSCLFALSIMKKNPDTCTDISDSESAAYCILNVAVRLQNASLCPRLAANGSVALCEQLVQEAAQTNSTT
jgi:hypothetical protein